MPPSGWEKVERVLAVRLDNVGDVVMLGPALRTLRASLPHAHITLMASPAGSQVAPLLPWVDNVMVHRAVWQDVSGAIPQDPTREYGFVEEVRQRGFDAALIFTSFSQSPYPPAYVCYLAAIPLRLGQSKEFGGSILTKWVSSLPDSAHQVDRNLHLLESAGFEAAGRHLELRIPESAQREADALLRGAGIDPHGPYIVMAPGASCPARRYSASRYAEVARALPSRTGMSVIIAGSPREVVLAEGMVGAAASRGVFSLAGRTSTAALVAVISKASLVIANDSGPMHMADAFGRPSVILYSGTEYESQWRPRNSPSQLLRRPTPCSPCFAFECPYNMECLDIPAGEVVDHALHALGMGRERHEQAANPWGVAAFAAE